jgi:hypothetical protein
MSEPLGLGTRFTPVARALVARGSHAAASQTVAQREKYGLVALETGTHRVLEK